jgi:Ala-tRNA(Pro) deacylase
MEIPKKLVSYLNEKKSPTKYSTIRKRSPHKPLPAAEHIKGRHHAKVVMVKSGDQHLMTVLPADSRLDLEKLEKTTGKHASLESEAEFKNRFPDCAPGTMPPFGDLYGVPTCVDRSLTKEDYIVFEAGTYTDAIKLSYSDYERAAKPHIQDFALKLHSVKTT